MEQNSDDEIGRYMQATLESTQRGCQLLDSCEKLGVGTTQELLVQREKLEKADRNLEDIQHTTQLTQRSLNSIKSVVGGFFRNLFSSSKPPNSAKKGDSLKAPAPPLRTIEQDAMPVRGTLSEAARAQIEGTRLAVMDDQIDKNLGVMSSQLSRLRVLGLALGEELGSQDRLIDSVQQKTDRNNDVVRRQKKQVDKLLR